MKISLSISKVILVHDHACLGIVCVSFCTTVAELGGCDILYVARKAQIFTSWPFIEQVCLPLAQIEPAAGGARIWGALQAPPLIG